MNDAPRVTDATLLAQLDPDKPVLIAGPTASGKSALALKIATEQGGRIINADASQVYDCWRVLTARPDATEEAQASHALYGHVEARKNYSVGHWLRDVAPVLQETPRAIIVGGTGLYFQALTQGLAEIPPIPPEIRARADTMLLTTLLSGLDAATCQRIDTANRARVQRAWEVQKATGRSLGKWQDTTPPPLLPLCDAQPILFDAPKDWLTPRIAQRFDRMIEDGALEEVRRMLPNYDPGLPAHRAIGAPELVAHLRGECSLSEAREAAIIATRQFAKRQRTWFRSKMRNWMTYTPGS